MPNKVTFGSSHKLYSFKTRMTVKLLVTNVSSLSQFHYCVYFYSSMCYLSAAFGQWKLGLNLGSLPRLNRDLVTKFAQAWFSTLLVRVDFQFPGAKPRIPPPLCPLGTPDPQTPVWASLLDFGTRGDFHVNWLWKRIYCSTGYRAGLIYLGECAPFCWDLHNCFTVKKRWVFLVVVVAIPIYTFIHSATAQWQFFHVCLWWGIQCDGATCARVHCTMDNPALTAG